MSFLPKVALSKNGDEITVWVRQAYKARGYKKAYRWRSAGIVTLQELEEAEKRRTES